MIPNPITNLWKKILACRRQNRQKLLERSEGFAHVKLHFHVGKTPDVGDPGSEVVRVEPGPRFAAIVVVVEVPLYCPHVPFGLYGNFFDENPNFDTLGKICMQSSERW